MGVAGTAKNITREVVRFLRDVHGREVDIGGGHDQEVKSSEIISPVGEETTRISRVVFRQGASDDHGTTGSSTPPQVRSVEDVVRAPEASSSAAEAEALRQWQQSSVDWKAWSSRLERLENSTKNRFGGFPPAFVAQDWSGKGLSFPWLIQNLLPPSIRDRVVLNVGGRDGKKGDPVYPLFEEYNYTGVVVEADKAFEKILEKTLAAVNHTGQIFPVIGAFAPSEWKGLLEKYHFPRNFDVLKIDIDSVDMAILRGILGPAHGGGYFRPKLVMMEYNADMPPPFQFYVDYGGKEEGTQEFKWVTEAINDHGLFGASADSLYAEMVAKRGYVLAGIQFRGSEHNLWFCAERYCGRGGRGWPTISAAAMTRWFWLADNQSGYYRGRCMHMKDFCPKNALPKIARRLVDSGEAVPSDGYELSRLIALHSNSTAVQETAKEWSAKLKQFCPGKCSTPVSVTSWGAVVSPGKGRGG